MKSFEYEGVKFCLHHELEPPTRKEVSSLEQDYHIKFHSSFFNFLTQFQYAHFSNDAYIMVNHQEYYLRCIVLFSHLKNNLKYRSKSDFNEYWPNNKYFIRFAELNDEEPFLYMGIKKPFLHEIHVIDRYNSDENGYIATVKIASNFQTFLKKIKC